MIFRLDVFITYSSPNVLGQARWANDSGIHKRSNPASPAPSWLGLGYLLLMIS